jgi:hypothetical protein
MLRKLALLALALAAVPAAQAQPVPTELATLSQPASGQVEIPMAVTAEDLPTATTRMAVETDSEAREAPAMRQGSARNVFALIGAVVVLVALFTLFN